MCTAPHRTVPCCAVPCCTVSYRTVGSKPCAPPSSGPCNACQRGRMQLRPGARPGCAFCFGRAGVVGAPWVRDYIYVCAHGSSLCTWSCCRQENGRPGRCQDRRADGQTGRQKGSAVTCRDRDQGPRTRAPRTGVLVGQVRRATCKSAGSGPGPGAKATGKLQPSRSKCGLDC